MIYDVLALDAVHVFQGTFLEFMHVFQGTFCSVLPLFQGTFGSKILIFLLKRKEIGNYFFLKGKNFPFSPIIFVLLQQYF